MHYFRYVGNQLFCESVSVAFAGPDNQYLYACASDKVFRRKTLVKGAVFAGK